MQVVVVDYGVGNLLSVSRAIEACGAEPRMAVAPDEIVGAERLILPGVGAFRDAMAELARRDFIAALRDYAVSGRPLLGICLGMQMLLDYSEEFGVSEGLGLIPGHVEAIPATDGAGKPHKIPHVGWAPLQTPEGAGVDAWRDSFLSQTPDGASAYFVHSFTAKPKDEAHRLADTDYNGGRISAAIKRGNVAGVQFHPERSGRIGLKMIERFVACGV